MKITSIETSLLTVPTRRQMALQFPHHKLVVAEIATDEGAKGMGYSMVFNLRESTGVLWYSRTVDITDLVIESLNTKAGR